MPARRLDNQEWRAQKYDVAGQDSDAKQEFIRHVGLCQDERADLRCGCEVVLAHMGPPLETRSAGHPIQTLGTLPLSHDQREQVRVFLDELDLEYQAQRARGKRQYTIYPHEVPPDETFPFRRFNCAGFVVEAYRAAGIDLLAMDHREFPTVSLDVLRHAYPDYSEKLNNSAFRSQYGLTGDGPWPVLMAGYVLNALGRSASAIVAEPYLPVSGDECFPTRAVQTGDILRSDD